MNPEDQDKPRKIITYARGRFLGKGGFAKCYEVKRIEPIETEEHETQTWALKVVPKVNLTRTKARQKLTSEIKIHRSMDHENVVRFDRYFEDKENVYIMLDICTNGSLSDLIKRRKRLHEVETRYYIYQLVKAIEYVQRYKPLMINSLDVQHELWDRIKVLEKLRKIEVPVAKSYVVYRG